MNVDRAVKQLNLGQHSTHGLPCKQPLFARQLIPRKCSLFSQGTHGLGKSEMGKVKHE